MTYNINFIYKPLELQAINKKRPNQILLTRSLFASIFPTFFRKVR